MKGKKMSKLEELVPPLHLCKLIPKGGFVDTALVWVFVDGEYFVIPRGAAQANIFLSAPTSEEILSEIVNLSTSCIKVCKGWGEWSIDCYEGERVIEKDSVKNIATAALKLWLEVKGIEA